MGTAQIIGTGGEIVGLERRALLIRPRSRFEQAVRDGRAYLWASKTYDPDAHDTILGVKNNDPDRLLHVKRISFTSDTASQIQVFTSSNPTMAGTAVVGQNCNRGSGRVPVSDGRADETGNAEQAAGYPALLFRDVVAVNIAKHYNLDGGIILPYLTMLGVDLTSAATAANAVLIGWFE